MKLRCLGLMSGMSMDGIDAAIVDISYKNSNFSFRCIDFISIPYSSKIKKRILEIGYSDTNKVSIAKSSEFNMLLGNLFGNAANKLIRKNSGRKVDVIGSHGQTIYYSNKRPVSTIQIGEASVISQITGVTTVSDIRQADIAAGGLGAPLAPTFHYHFFKPLKKTVAVINIGSISNATFINPSLGENGVIGFDMGPGNILIDTAMRILFNKQYDKNGIIAKRGKLIKALYDTILSKSQINKKPPKSVGFVFGSSFAKNIISKNKNCNKDDIIHTITKASADIMAMNIKKHLPQNIIEEFVFCGGGAHNSSLINFFKNNFENPKIKTFTDYGIHVDAVEAVFMAFIGYTAIMGIPITLPKTTGAKEKVILGKITKAPIRISADK